MKITIRNDYQYEFISKANYIFLKDKKDEEIIGIKIEFWNSEEISIRTIQYTDTPADYKTESPKKIKGLAQDFVQSFMDNAFPLTKKISFIHINAEAGKKFTHKIISHYKNEKIIIENIPSRVDFINKT